MTEATTQVAPQGRVSRSAISPLAWALMVALAAALLWGAWLTRTVLDVKERKSPIVKVQLQGLIGEYVRAQARSDQPQEQIVAQTKMFIAMLQKTVADMSRNGQIVLVNEAVVGDNVPDLTADVRKAVYAKVPMPKVASSDSVESKMLAYLSKDATSDGNGK